jgi:hypothetical protein
MVDRGAQWATNKFTRITGMATWNSVIKSLTSALEQDALLKAVQKGAANLKPYDMAKFAQNGIGADELKRIGEQFAKHGENDSGLFRARTDLWEDRAAAQLVEDAIVKTGNIMSIRRGVGDLPLFMNGEVARTLLQFKSFGMASVTRIMIPVAQGLFDDADSWRNDLCAERMGSRTGTRSFPGAIDGGVFELVGGSGVSARRDGPRHWIIASPASRHAI